MCFFSFLCLRKKEEKECDICGVEIADGAAQVNEHPFKRNTAFLLGNEVDQSTQSKDLLHFVKVCDFKTIESEISIGVKELV